MSNEEINRYIHENILGNDYEATIPDYCSDASPRSLLNEVVVRLRQTLPIWDVSKRLPDVFENSMCMPATAEQIARACVEAHKNK